MTPDQITGDAELDAALHKYMDARTDLHRLIREARAAGMTLRHIASIVGLSVETVRKITMTCLVAVAAAILCATATAAGSPTTTQILTHVAQRPVTAICTPTTGEMSYTNLNAAGTGPGSSARINAGDCKLVARMIRQRFQWQASYDEQVALVAVIHEGMHLRGGPRWRDESYTQCRALHELPKVAAWLGVQLQDARENARWIWRYSHPGYHDGYCAGFTS